MRRISLFFLLAAALSLNGCAKPEPPEAGKPENIGLKNTATNYCRPLDYQNGVLYFPCANSEFGNGLSRYRQDHPDVRVAAMAADDSSSSGYTTGYFVTVEKKPKP